MVRDWRGLICSCHRQSIVTNASELVIVLAY